MKRIEDAPNILVKLTTDAREETTTNDTRAKHTAISKAFDAFDWCSLKEGTRYFYRPPTISYSRANFLRLLQAGFNLFSSESDASRLRVAPVMT